MTGEGIGNYSKTIEVQNANKWEWLEFQKNDVVDGC